MDKSVLLGDCRKLLRLIECEAVTDEKDQNLYDILIRSEEKKIVLLTWLIQNLFTPNQCANNSFENLLSMFMTNVELSSFLKGTMSIEDQFRIWKLLMNTVYEKKNRNNSNSQNTTHDILNGKLLDEFIESWNQKVEKPTICLVAGSKRISDLQNQLSTAREQLNQLNSLPESTPESFAASTDMKIKEISDIIQKFFDSNRAFNQRLNQHIKSSSNYSDCPSSINFIQEIRKNFDLQNIERNLVQLRDIMNCYASKN